MPLARSWIRFAGLLWEDLTFDPDVGWETDSIARRPPAGDGSWRVELLDEQGAVLARTHPEVVFERTSGQAMQRARIATYVPFRPGARVLRLVQGEQVVHTGPVSPMRPKIQVNECTVDDRHVKLKWQSLHPDPEGGPISFRVVWAAPGRGAFLVAEELTAPWLTLPLDALPGATRGRFAVLATDGVRSAVDLSEAIDVPMRAARLAIVDPEHGASFSAGQPITLRGSLHDDAGRRLSPKGLTWLVDGQEVAHDTALLRLDAPRGGRRTITLSYDGDGAAPAKATCRVAIAHADTPAAPDPVTPEGSAPRGPLRIKL